MEGHHPVDLERDLFFMKGQMMKTILIGILLTYLLMMGFIGMILFELPDIVCLYTGIILGIIGGAISIRGMANSIDWRKND